MLFQGKTMHKSLLALTLSLALLIAGCVHQGAFSGPWTVIDVPGDQNMTIQKILATQQSLDKPAPNLDRVMILRMTIDGKRVETTSIAPSKIIAEPARGNLTLFNLTDRKKLVLFTRDGKGIRGYLMEIPVSELLPGKAFDFPVAQDPGEVVLKTITVEQLIVQE
jgi:hypothetical protein